jgi:outer membrane protein assembly factor BamD
MLAIGCGSKNRGVILDAEDQFARAKKLYDNEKYFKAIGEFQKVIFNYPGATLIDSALYYLAMSYFGDKDYELAAVEFRRLSSSYPQSDFRDGAQYMAAVCFLKNSPKHYALDQEDLKRGIGLLEEFIIDNPDSPWMEDARQSIQEGYAKLAQKTFESGMLYFRMYDFRAAEIYFQYVIDNYTDTEYAAQALFKMSEMSYRMKKYEEALTRFNNFTAIYPSNELVTRANEYIDEITRYLETGSVEDES